MSEIFGTTDRCIVLYGASGGIADRLQGLVANCVQRVTNPIALAHVLSASSDRSMLDRCREQIVGLVFDLTGFSEERCHSSEGVDTGVGSAVQRLDPQGLRGHDQEGCLARFCSALLISLPHMSRLPIVIVSHDDVLAAALRVCCGSCVAQLDPDTDDTMWRSALEAAGLSGKSGTHTPAGMGHGHTGPKATELMPQERYYLHARVWVDLAHCLIWKEDEHPVALTGREVQVLRVLMRRPGRFYSASQIAQQATSVGSWVDAHCIEQTISGLRRKLGETGRAQRAIVSRRGLGYALVTEQHSTFSRSLE